MRRPGTASRPCVTRSRRPASWIPTMAGSIGCAACERSCRRWRPSCGTRPTRWSNEVNAEQAAWARGPVAPRRCRPHPPRRVDLGRIERRSAKMAGCSITSSIQCADVAASAAFYDAVLAPLGGVRMMDFGDAIGFGVPPMPDFWIGRARHRRGLPRVAHRVQARRPGHRSRVLRRRGRCRRRGAARAAGVAGVPPELLRRLRARPRRQQRRGGLPPPRLNQVERSGLEERQLRVVGVDGDGSSATSAPAIAPMEGAGTWPEARRSWSDSPEARRRVGRRRRGSTSSVATSSVTRGGPG